jgi:hypothetical protein
MEVEENYWVVMKEPVGRKKSISVGNEGVNSPLLVQTYSGSR